MKAADPPSKSRLHIVTKGLKLSKIKLNLMLKELRDYLGFSTPDE